jgi:acyl-CoA thioester hydrolase
MDMARVKIELPKTFDFSADFEVRIADINAGGHLGNHLLVSLLNEAHLKFMVVRGFPELMVDGRAVINTDLSVIYKSEAFYGDVLTIEVAAGDFHKYGFDLFYRVTSKKSGKVVAIAKTGMVFFDYTERKIAEIPDKFKKLFGI